LLSTGALTFLYADAGDSGLFPLPEMIFFSFSGALIGLAELGLPGFEPDPVDGSSLYLTILFTF
jgi:hypothetical protein